QASTRPQQIDAFRGVAIDRVVHNTVAGVATDGPGYVNSLVPVAQDLVAQDERRHRLLGDLDTITQIVSHDAVPDGRSGCAAHADPDLERLDDTVSHYGLCAVANVDAVLSKLVLAGDVVPVAIERRSATDDQAVPSWTREIGLQRHLAGHSRAAR